LSEEPPKDPFNWDDSTPAGALPNPDASPADAVPPADPPPADAVPAPEAPQHDSFLDTMPVSPPPPAEPAEEMDRRAFLSRATSVAMGASLVASYGAFAAMAGRFLYPARPPLKGWLFVADVASFKQGASLAYTAPDGASVAIARQGATGSVADFIALSSTCPHLGCQVHWEGQNQRFFCPCHNGAFDPSGKAIAGPPHEAGQSLGRYPLRIDAGVLYIEVPLEGLPGQEEA
jgi:cytochrome b6-f complex iron-sulfur subunit